MDMINRRRALISLTASTITTCGSQEATIASFDDKTDQVNTVAKYEILMLVYPRLTLMDLIGPQHVLALLGPEYKTRLVWKDKGEVVSDTGVPIRPTQSFSECTTNPFILFVPGGTDGTLAVMEDKEVRTFIEKMGAKATYVTSVCTGSLVLGSAGLLQGYKATSHWLALKALEKFGATPVADRVVIDRNRVTGAGVTAGIDFALTLTSMIKGEQYARSVQLMMEYDPKPPYNSGNPKIAEPESVKMLEAMTAPFLQDLDAVADRISKQT